jgi:hypothetical protein
MIENISPTTTIFSKQDKNFAKTNITKKDNREQGDA